MRRAAIAVVVLATFAAPEGAADEPSVLFQYSTINALLAGLYDGDMSIAELADHGGFGIGTVDGLDGELIAVDGRFYHVRDDGVARALPDDAESPFAVVTEFVADKTSALPGGLDLAGLAAHLDAQLSSPNGFAAIRIDGTFPAMTVRSVAAQSRPYRPLAEVIESQVVFKLTDIRGTLIGIRMPGYMAGLNVAGQHFHFLTDDRRRGGHVLGLTTGAGTIAIDEIDTFVLRLPGHASFAGADLTGRREEAVKKVEQARD